MNDHVHNVLFLSRRNSARSILAEALLNTLGKGRFVGYSAAVEPVGEIDPKVLALLKTRGLPIPQGRPKHYSEFAGASAPRLDFVFTLSDTTAGEPLPEWLGQPVTAHWSSPDPLLEEGPDWKRNQAFEDVLRQLERRLNIFIQLPFAALDRLSVKKHLDELGSMRDASNQ